MKLPRRNFLHLAAGVAALPIVSGSARAQAYPSRPVRLMVGFPRVGCRYHRAHHRPVVVGAARPAGRHRNRPGASSTLAPKRWCTRRPTATRCCCSGGPPSMATLITSFPFDLQRDLAPVSGLTDLPMVLVAHPSVPAKTVAELIALAKGKPGTISMGSFGTGSASHLAGELFKMMAGVNLLHVP